MQRIICTVTNSLSYDQRMQRICTSLAANGFEVLLVGRKQPNMPALETFNFSQKRISCFCNKGFAFYAEFSLRLFFFLLFTKADVYCAIDLDTILPNYFASAIKGKKRVYDAHELFTEQKEIVTRKRVHQFWLAIEKFAVPKYIHGYTVNFFIKEEFKRRYGMNYEVIRNLPRTDWQLPVGSWQQPNSQTPTIIYQGAVNEGRSFETLIPAMKSVNAQLLICGEGNFFEQVKQLIKENGMENKVTLRGYVSPKALKTITPTASFGLTLFENTGLNQYYSLSNRFFDYIMAGIPQVCVGYPEYKVINDEFDIALLINNTQVETIATALNQLLADSVLYERLKLNTQKARQYLNWGNEEKKLIEFWKKL